MSLSQKLDCCSHCDTFQDKYNRIKASGANWLTISPPRRDGKPNTLYKRDKEMFLCNLKKFADEFICVAEIANERLHYHILYSLSNKIYRFKYFGGIAETLRYQYKDYRGEPKKGEEWDEEKYQPIHYLFKDVDEAIEYGIKEPITTEMNYKKNPTKPKPKWTILDPLDDKPIPKWMLN